MELIFSYNDIKKLGLLSKILKEWVWCWKKHKIYYGELDDLSG